DQARRQPVRVLPGAHPVEVLAAAVRVHHPADVARQALQRLGPPITDRRLLLVDHPPLGLLVEARAQRRPHVPSHVASFRTPPASRGGPTVSRRTAIRAYAESIARSPARVRGAKPSAADGSID